MIKILTEKGKVNSSVFKWKIQELSQKKNLMEGLNWFITHDFSKLKVSTITLLVKPHYCHGNALWLHSVFSPNLTTDYGKLQGQISPSSY